jgi:hypothetical protein
MWLYYRVCARPPQPAPAASLALEADQARIRRQSSLRRRRRRQLTLSGISYRYSVARSPSSPLALDRCLQRQDRQRAPDSAQPLPLRPHPDAGALRAFTGARSRQTTCSQSSAGRPDLIRSVLLACDLVKFAQHPPEPAQAADPTLPSLRLGRTDRGRPGQARSARRRRVMISRHPYPARGTHSQAETRTTFGRSCPGSTGACIACGNTPYRPRGTY